MFYRSGWLRCVGLKYVVFGSGLCSELVYRFMCRAGVMCLTLGVYYILYYYYIIYYIIIHIHIILLYLIYTLLPFLSPSSPLPLQSSHSKYTCRCLLLDTYISSSDPLPLSIFHRDSDPACFIGVDG